MFWIMIADNITDYLAHNLYTIFIWVLVGLFAIACMKVVWDYVCHKWDQWKWRGTRR